MKSTPARSVPTVPAAAAAAAPVAEYTHTLSNHTTHVWNIQSSPSTAAAALAAVSDFYLYENMSSVNVNQSPHTHLNKSFPRHHALVCASLGSTRELIARAAAGRAGVCRKRYTNEARTTAYQKHHLVSMSGLAGLLIARWTGVTGARAHTIKTAKKHAEITAKYTHSVLACEFLVSNRYYRDLPHLLVSSLSTIVGNDNSTLRFTRMTPADVTPEIVAATKTELIETYTAQIDRLLDAVKQYKRGFMGIQAIRSDPEFTRLMCAYWRYCNQVTKLHQTFEQNRYDSGDSDGYSDGDDRGDGDRSERFATRRFLLASNVCSVVAMVPQLYNYDIVHLFDGASQGYARYVKTAKFTLVRLSNDGLTTAFLSFAVIEPQMVTAEMAPKHGTKYVTTSILSCANHIPSRDPLFGALRVKHRALIPRTADAVNAADIQGIPRSPTLVRHAMITSATRVAYTERRAAAAVAAAEAAAEAADGWTVVCSRRKRK